ncbi:uncharacterized protein GGS25DRAFT_208783 [Hypoxylon fragiforme]|uniref:uncharacterized protein n=1 Tax=Hypoxylon fragiforme TaxID=63214 RepID=UPI0020C623FD|nr:uncharacterized protein GGS25DRAFT_208783 [Hypoxylon fragiforme]KAI2611750.1 hypothetical protein GGS25DRAFT_208783 [Hypoxylon fragiforme]
MHFLSSTRLIGGMLAASLAILAGAEPIPVPTDVGSVKTDQYAYFCCQVDCVLCQNTDCSGGKACTNKSFNTCCETNLKEVAENETLHFNANGQQVLFVSPAAA